MRNARKSGEKWLKNRRPEYWSVVEAIVNAGIPQRIPNQYARARDLEKLLERHRPASIVEPGSGLSTMVFARYCAHNESRLQSHEESPEFCALVGDVLANKGLDRYRPMCVAKLVTPEGCRYQTDMPACDFAYVDGPSNTIDGIAHDCLDVVAAITAGNRPRVIVIDGRVGTTNAIIRASGDAYRWSFANKYANKMGRGSPDRCGHHTVGVLRP